MPITPIHNSRAPVAGGRFQRAIAWLLMGAGFVLGVPASQGAALFAAPIQVANSGGAIATVAADLNGDGRAEFISAASKESGGAHLRIYAYQPATGSFTNYTILNGATLATRQDRFGGDLEVADINRDGFPDIIVPESDNGDGPGRVSWFENPQGNLAGVWVEHVISVWTGAPGDSVAHMSEVAVGDIDGNGWPDVVTRDISHGCYVLLQNNTGTGWQPRRFIATNPREGLALWNPDGDGDLDILLNGVWLETPANPLLDAFVPRTIAPAWYPAGNGGAVVNDYACKVATGDFNGDGRTDVLISNAEELDNAPSTESKPKGIRLYLAPADPVNDPWPEVVLHAEHFSWHTLQVADIDGDGDLDVVSGISIVGADTTPPQIVAFLNDGTGTAFVPQTIASGLDALFLDQYCYNATLADADGDGRADLLAPDNWNSGPLRFFLNLSTNSVTNIVSTPPNTPANFTAVPLSSTRVELSWLPQSTNHHGFRIERRVNDEEEFAEIAQTGSTVTVFTDTGLSPSAEHTYRVRAFNPVGDSNHSVEVQASTPPDFFYEWQVNNFGEDPEPSLADDAQDPDFDSIPNLLEYLHGSDPNTHDTASPMTFSANGRLRITFRRDPATADITATVQAASSPNGPWLDVARSSTGAAFTPLVPGTEVSEIIEGSLRRVSVSDLYPLTDPAQPTRFLRLRLER